MEPGFVFIVYILTVGLCVLFGLYAIHRSWLWEGIVVPAGLYLSIQFGLGFFDQRFYHVDGYLILATAPVYILLYVFWHKFPKRKPGQRHKYQASGISFGDSGDGPG